MDSESAWFSKRESEIRLHASLALDPKAVVKQSKYALYHHNVGKFDCLF